MENTINLTTAQENLLNLIKENAVQQAEGLFYKGQKQDLAQALKVSLRTITRHLKTLSDNNIVTVASRRGAKGGVIIGVYQGVELESHPDNVFTGTTKKAKQLRDKYFPNQGTYTPDGLTPEERIRIKHERNEQKKKDAILNAQIRQIGHPTKEIFEQTDDPELNYKAYLLGKLYEALMVAFPEEWRNEAEAKGNEEEFKRASSYVARVENWTALKQEFFGSVSHYHFKKLVRYLDRNVIDPFDYLGSQFEYNDYRMRRGDSNVQPPFTNTLLTEDAILRYEMDVDWKSMFDEEHPYYAKDGDTRTRLMNIYPIITLILAEYKNPFHAKHDPQGEIAKKRGEFGNTNYQDKLIEFHDQTLEQVDNDSKLDDKEKEQVKKFVSTNVATALRDGGGEITFLRAYHNQIAAFKNSELDIEDIDKRFNMRRVYGKLGQMHSNPPTTQKQLMHNIKRGYRLYFSATAHRGFTNTLKTISSMNNLENQNELWTGLRKMENPLPMNQHHFLDLTFVRELLDEKELNQDKALADLQADVDIEEHQIYNENTVDKPIKLWYDIPVSDLVSEERDGTQLFQTQD